MIDTIDAQNVDKLGVDTESFILVNSPQQEASKKC